MTLREDAPRLNNDSDIEARRKANEAKNKAKKERQQKEISARNSRYDAQKNSHFNQERYNKASINRRIQTLMSDVDVAQRLYDRAVTLDQKNPTNKSAEDVKKALDKLNTVKAQFNDAKARQDSLTNKSTTPAPTPSASATPSSIDPRDLARQQQTATSTTLTPSPTPTVATNTTISTSATNRGENNTNVGIDFSKFSPAADGSWSWSDGVGVDAGTNEPVVLFGDKNGSPLVFTNFNKTIAPVMQSDYKKQLLTKYGSKPGGISQLKQMLVRSNFVTGSAAKNLDVNSDIYNPLLGQALDFALMQGTAENQAQATHGVKKFMSFEDWIKTAKASPVWGTTTGGSGTPSRTVSISRQKFRPEEFDIAIDDLFQRTIGRGASNDEVKQFIGMLNSYQNKHPQKTVTTTHGNTSTQVTSGGVNSAVAEAKMKELAMQNPDAENYNKATKYLDYFKAAIASPVQLG